MFCWGTSTAVTGRGIDAALPRKGKLLPADTWCDSSRARRGVCTRTNIGLQTHRVFALSCRERKWNIKKGERRSCSRTLQNHWVFMHDKVHLASLEPAWSPSWRHQNRMFANLLHLFGIRKKKKIPEGDWTKLSVTFKEVSQISLLFFFRTSTKPAGNCTELPVCARGRHLVMQQRHGAVCRQCWTLKMWPSADHKRPHVQRPVTETQSDLDWSISRRTYAH